MNNPPCAHKEDEEKEGFEDEEKEGFLHGLTTKSYITITNNRRRRKRRGGRRHTGVTKKKTRSVGLF
jgi:hypothetical protein